MQIEIDPSLDLDISIQPFFTDCEIEIKSEGEPLFHETLNRVITEVIYRSLSVGRRKFLVPTMPSDAELVMKAFWDWFPPLLENIRSECALSSFGTEYEGEIEKVVMHSLSWSENLTLPDPCGQFSIQRIAK